MLSSSSIQAACPCILELHPLLKRFPCIVNAVVDGFHRSLLVHLAEVISVEFQRVYRSITEWKKQVEPAKCRTVTWVAQHMVFRTAIVLWPTYQRRIRRLSRVLFPIANLHANWPMRRSCAVWEDRQVYSWAHPRVDPSAFRSKCKQLWVGSEKTSRRSQLTNFCAEEQI